VHPGHGADFLRPGNVGEAREIVYCFSWPLRVAKHSQQPVPMQQVMPDEEGWHEIDVGPRLRMMFHPNRRGRQPDEIERPSIVVALAWQRTQVLRLDPFSERAHYHIRPRQGGQHLPLEVKEGQTPLAAALSLFDEEPDRFRALLVDAEQPYVAAQVQNANCATRRSRSVPSRLPQGRCPPPDGKEPRCLACGSSGSSLAAVR
jgi:hypothetical protein